MRTRWIVILGLAVALFVACGGNDDSTPTATSTPIDPNALADPQDALDAARDLWAQQGGDDYDMTFNWQCFCIVDFVQRVDLEVRGDAIEGGVVTDSGDPVSTDMLAEYQTVDALFDLIQDAIDRDAAEIRVTYAGAGYPDEVWIDYDHQIADEERGFFIHSLSVS
jgi:hypothetical protein